MNDFNASIQDKVDRYNRSLGKLKEFRSLRKGWDLGRGDLIQTHCIDSAVQILDFSFRIGLWKSSVFPTPSGSVLLAFPYHPSKDVEIYIDVDGTYDFSFEQDNETTQNFPCLSYNEVIQKIHDLWSSEYSTKNVISIMTRNVTAVQPSSRLVMEDYLFSAPNVQSVSQPQFVNTSKSIMLKSQESHQPTGILITH